MTKEELKKTKEYAEVPTQIKKSTLPKDELCKLLAVVHAAEREGDADEFFGLLGMVQKVVKDPSLVKIKPRPPLPEKFAKVIKPTYRLFHGRSASRSGNIWKSSHLFRKVMWFAVEMVTPLVYASMSPKGGELDKSHRWDLYEVRVKKPVKMLVISKESIQFIISEYGDVKCDGKTLRRWIKEAFPIKRGKLYRNSYISSDRKMASCLCASLDIVGYISPEIKVPSGFGVFHREAMFCNPAGALRLVAYRGFSTKSAQESVRKFLDGVSRKLQPDVWKKF